MKFNLDDYWNEVLSKIDGCNTDFYTFRDIYMIAFNHGHCYGAHFNNEEIFADKDYADFDNVFESKPKICSEIDRTISQFEEEIKNKNFDEADRLISLFSEHSSTRHKLELHKQKIELLDKFTK